MEVTVIALFMFIVVLALLLVGIPVAFVFGSVAIVFAFLIPELGFEVRKITSTNNSRRDADRKRRESANYETHAKSDPSRIDSGRPFTGNAE
mgnify:CR=1 FL=1